MAERVCLTPDYYPHFACKCGRCRHTCCRGWNISFTMAEYFHLLGMNCTRALRHKLDGAFHLADHPDAQRYAVITPDWRGKCPLQAEDGLCLLQGEKGEGAMPLVCRYYPRAPRAAFGYACACLNSCEGVLELLFADSGTLAFSTRRLDIDLPLPEPLRNETLRDCYAEIQARTLRALARRDLPLPERLALVGVLTTGADAAAKGGDYARVLRAARAFDPLGALPAPGAGALSRGEAFGDWLTLVRALSHDSVSLRAQWPASLQALGLYDREKYAPGTLGEAEAACCARAAAFAHAFPQWEAWFERALCNHLFAQGYPYTAGRENLIAQHMALCLVYCVMRYYAVTLAAPGERDTLVDALAAAFRMMEHGSFDEAAPRVAELLQLDDVSVRALTQF